MSNAIEQEIRSQIENAAHEIVMPEVRLLEELFEEIEVIHDIGAYCEEARPPVHRWHLTPGNGICEMAGFVGIHGTQHSLHAVPRPEILESLSKTMLMSDGFRINFAITIRGATGCALVSANHSRLISSRWYAIIDANEVLSLAPVEDVG